MVDFLKNSCLETTHKVTKIRGRKSVEDTWVRKQKSAKGVQHIKYVKRWTKKSKSKGSNKEWSHWRHFFPFESASISIPPRVSLATPSTHVPLYFLGLRPEPCACRLVYLLVVCLLHQVESFMRAEATLPYSSFSLTAKHNAWGVIGTNIGWINEWMNKWMKEEKNRHYKLMIFYINMGSLAKIIFKSNLFKYC